MLQLSPSMQIFVGIDPIDFRVGIDALCRTCGGRIGKDPLSGALFVFTNRSRTGIKILAYDGNAFWLCYRRLSHGKLTWWPGKAGDAVSVIGVQELAVLLWNGDPRGVFQEHFRPVAKLGVA